MAVEYDRTAPILNNTAVDNIVDQPGEIDQLATLSLDMPDRDIIRNLNQRIDDSEQYWNDAKGFDLKNARAENTRCTLAKSMSLACTSTRSSTKKTRYSLAKSR
jgi:hypothetical protein